MERNQPLTPFGRISVQPNVNHLLNTAVVFENPIDIPSFKTLIQNSIMCKHPRFCSLMVKDKCSGRERWDETPVDIDSHLIILQHPISEVHDNDEDAVNDYMADLSVSSPLPIDKPLWEIHLLMAHKTAIFRVNHALGDGFSLFSMFQSFDSKRAKDEHAPKKSVAPTTEAPRNGFVRMMMMMIKYYMSIFWYSVVFAIKLGLRVLWVKDKTTALSGGDGVELWPRKVATARFRLDDIKSVKRIVPNATINDVVVGAISYGFSRYLDVNSAKDLKEGTQITGVTVKNLRPQTRLQDTSDGNYETWWGNKFGAFLLPIHYHKSKDPLQFVKRAKTIMDKKKLSLEPLICYKVLNFATFLATQLGSTLYDRVVRNTTFFFTNVIGPRDDITLAGNPVKTVRGTSSNLPQAIVMHMVSYAGFAVMQISVAKDIIPDPKVLANYFEDALLQMKQAAKAQDSLNSK